MVNFQLLRIALGMDVGAELDSSDATGAEAPWLAVLEAVFCAVVSSFVFSSCGSGAHFAIGVSLVIIWSLWSLGGTGSEGHVPKL